VSRRPPRGPGARRSPSPAKPANPWVVRIIAVVAVAIVVVGVALAVAQGSLFTAPGGR
jgi:hypothetical protein